MNAARDICHDVCQGRGMTGVIGIPADSSVTLSVCRTNACGIQGAEESRDGRENPGHRSHLAGRNQALAGKRLNNNTMVRNKPTNRNIAAVMDQIAGLLEIQHANPFRVRAYRSGAKFVRNMKEPLADLVKSGDGQALQTMPHIGEGLARLIEEYVKTGKSGLLLRLQGEVSPEDVFGQVPGIGKELGERIARKLDVKTLEELEQAAHDGRLAGIRGFGRRRVEAIRMSLAGMLSGFARRRIAKEKKDVPEQPPVALLLAADAEYRRKAAAGTLKKITPKRFNPKQQAWLPVLHTEKDGWSFTALFSNTARAHELGKTHDWVIVFYERDKYDGQATVVTETSGPLAGKRVVRGREQECIDL